MPRDMENNRLWQRNYYKKRKLQKPETYLLAGAKRRARDSGLDFNITIEDIDIPEKCPILDIPLKVVENGARSSSPSLDRIDSTKGYVKGNVRVISMKANAAKSDLTPDQIRKLCLYVFGLERTQ